MFGNTLKEVMDLQRDIFPDRTIPWIQQTLSEQILLMGGKQTEGIFRVSADVDEVNCLKGYVDKWEFPENKGSMGKKSKFNFKVCALIDLNSLIFRCSCSC